MAYDRYDPERPWRDDDERRAFGWDRDRDDPRFNRRDYDRGHEDRGFFERMGDEFRSWFGDEDRTRGYADGRDAGYRHDHPRWSNVSERQAGRSGGENRGDYRRADVRDRDPYRGSSFARNRPNASHADVHYGQWRRQQMQDLDRDYDDYRRERQTYFEKDFGDWRSRRLSKRQLLGGIREHMEVVGSDEKHVGTVDRISGDRIILTRSDPDSGGIHHSLSCSDIDRLEGERVILECDASKARERWRDESRGRALFEPDDQGSAGPHMLDRSFSGTYR